MSLFEKYNAIFPEEVATICRGRANGHLAHAYLLHCDNELLQREFSALMAQIMICPDCNEAGEPCGKCLTCNQISQWHYPYLQLLEPQGKMGQIKVGDGNNPEPNTVRYFMNQFYLTNISDIPGKIGIILEAEALNSKSQNAMLKMLEEPPPESYFILVTANPARLLPTTRSRCRILTVLEGKQNFNREIELGLFKILTEMQFHNDNSLKRVVRLTAELKNCRSQLENVELQALEQRWSKRLDEAAEYDPGIAKNVQEQYENTVWGYKAKLTKRFLDAIYTCQAQIFQLACGVKMEDLTNREIFSGCQIPVKPDPERARRALEHIEKLQFNLGFNVNEELEIQLFALNTAFDIVK